jgi:hypothetical protein
LLSRYIKSTTGRWNYHAATCDGVLSGKQQTEHQGRGIGRKFAGFFQEIASVHLHRVRYADFVRLGIHIFYPL